MNTIHRWSRNRIRTTILLMKILCCRTSVEFQYTGPGSNSFFNILYLACYTLPLIGVWLFSLSFFRDEKIDIYAFPRAPMTQSRPLREKKAHWALSWVQRWVTVIAFTSTLIFERLYCAEEDRLPPGMEVDFVSRLFTRRERLHPTTKVLWD